MITDHHQGGMIEVLIKGEKKEEEEAVSFIDALIDHLGITGVVIRIHRLTIMIHTEKVTMMIMVQTMVQTDLLCTLIPTALEDLLGEVVARLKLYKMKAVPRSM